MYLEIEVAASSYCRVFTRTILKASIGETCCDFSAALIEDLPCFIHRVSIQNTRRAEMPNPQEVASSQLGSFTVYRIVEDYRLLVNYYPSSNSEVIDVVSRF